VVCQVVNAEIEGIVGECVAELGKVGNDRQKLDYLVDIDYSTVVDSGQM
jgi:hypothetical protein